ncbi:hypothetical protein BDV12DRAFT_167543 [Aspergillus spectabilis]
MKVQGQCLVTIEARSNRRRHPHQTARALHPKTQHIVLLPELVSTFCNRITEFPEATRP